MRNFFSNHLLIYTADLEFGGFCFRVWFIFFRLILVFKKIFNLGIKSTWIFSNIFTLSDCNKILRSTQSFITQEGTTQTACLGHNASASLETRCGKWYWKPWINPGRPYPPRGAHQLSRLLCRRRRSGYQEWFALGESRLAFPSHILHLTYERRICSITFSGTVVRLMGL